MNANNLPINENESWSNTLSSTKKSYPSSSDSIEVVRLRLYYSQSWGQVFPLFTSSADSYKFDGNMTEKIDECVSAITEGVNAIMDNESEERKKNNNVLVLNNIKYTQSSEDDDYVPEGAIDNSLYIVYGIPFQPEVFKTGSGSIQMQFETPDRSYLEFEVFENRITCMVVPKREYDNAVFPEIAQGNIQGINEIIVRFFNEFGNN